MALSILVIWEESETVILKKVDRVLGAINLCIKSMALLANQGLLGNVVGCTW